MKKIIEFSVFSLCLLFSNTSVLGATIGLFNNPDYIVQNPSNNLVGILNSFDHEINEFTSFEASEWQKAANENQLLFIPSPGSDIVSQFSNQTLNVIRNYVATGGGLIVAGPEDLVFPLFNVLFGWTVVEDFTNSPFSLNTVNSVGTVFENAPSIINPALTTTPASIASLPSGGISIYDNGGNSTALFVNSIGLGQLAYISFSYIDIQSEPNWATVTNLTVEYVAKQADNPISIPEPYSLIGLTTVFLSGLLIKKLN